MHLTLRVFMTLVAAALLVSCAHQPLENEPEKYDASGYGPGVLSGPDGSFTILGGTKKKKRY
ncbi:MAG: hypothetical protein P1U65_14280 [Minwuia sp.]|nr:hypothetical protein [Minwuia sp.]